MPDIEQTTEEQGNALFDQTPYLIRVQGNRDYLPVAARIKWFRMANEHPHGSIESEEVEVILDYLPEGARSGTRPGYARFKATIRDENGRILAEAYKTETASNFPDYVEKANTGAIGRALAMAGYGTALDADIDEGRVVDTPRERAPRGQGTRTTRRNAAPTGAGRTEAAQAAPSAEERIASKLAFLGRLAVRIGYADLEAAAAHYNWNYAQLQVNEELMNVAHGIMIAAVQAQPAAPAAQ